MGGAWSFRRAPSEFRDPVSRRHFIRFMSGPFCWPLSFRQHGVPPARGAIMPFTKQPLGYLHGCRSITPRAMPTRGSALPLGGQGA